MKRIEEYTKQLHTSVSNYWMQKASLWITQLCGKSGMGKTFLAQSYLEAYGGQYFTFRNLDAAFAPQIFRPGCKLWREFFAETGEIKNRPVIFFDDVDDRNDKEEFLNALPELVGKAYVVLIVRNQMSLSFPSDILQMTAVTVPMLLTENKALDPLDALRTIAITDGIPELVRLFDFQKPFAENLGVLFTQNSAYFRYAESELRQHFRTPETYNILLYGMATGHNRISQLAEFSGFPQNKCDKYLKASDKAELLETVQRKDTAGHVRTHYYPKGGYWKTWFRYVFPSQGCCLKPLEWDSLQQLADDIDCAIVVEYFKKVCWQWMKKNYGDYYWDEVLRFDDPKQQNVTVNGVHFDYVQETKDHTIYVKIWDDIREGFPKAEFQKIETVTTKNRPFYENIYFLFSAGRACNYVEQLRNLDTVSMVDLKSLLGQKNKELF
jgi:hypothetical protein